MGTALREAGSQRLACVGRRLWKTRGQIVNRTENDPPDPHGCATQQQEGPIASHLPRRGEGGCPRVHVLRAIFARSPYVNAYACLGRVVLLPFPSPEQDAEGRSRIRLRHVRKDAGWDEAVLSMPLLATDSASPSPDRWEILGKFLRDLAWIMRNLGYTSIGNDMSRHPSSSIKLWRIPCPPSTQVQPTRIGPYWLTHSQSRRSSDVPSEASVVMTSKAGSPGRSCWVARSVGVSANSSNGWAQDARPEMSGRPVRTEVRHHLRRIEEHAEIQVTWSEVFGVNLINQR